MTAIILKYMKYDTINFTLYLVTTNNNDATPLFILLVPYYSNVLHLRTANNGTRCLI